MDAIFMNQIALGIFLVLNLVVAYWATKGAPKTMESYALANRSLGTATLLISLFATLMSADNIGLYLPFCRGVVGLLPPLTFAFMSVFLGYFVFPKLVHFRKKYTIAGVMGTIYGPFAQVATTLIMTLFSVLIIVGQLKEFGQMGEFLRVSPSILTAGMGLFITCYTAVGGVRSVAFTDVLQFAVFSLGLLIFTKIVIHSFGGVNAVWERFPNESAHGAFLSHPNFGTRFFSAFFWSIWPTILISPPIVQRVLMTPNEKQVQTMFCVFGVGYIFIRLLTFLAGMTLFSVNNLAMEKVTIKVIVIAICQDDFGQLVFVLALAAIVMSTADSLLNSASTMCTHNLLINPFQEKKQKDKIALAPIVTLFLGFLGTLVAVFSDRDLMSLMEYTCIIVSVLTIPFIMGVLGLRGSAKGFKASFLTFYLVLFGTYLLASKGYLASLTAFVNSGSVRQSFGMKNSYFARVGWWMAIISSTIVFFWEHYQCNGRFVFVKRDKGVWRVSGSYRPKVNFRFLTDSVRWADEKVASCGSFVVIVAFTMLFFPTFPVLFGKITYNISRDYLFFPLFIVSVFLMSFLLGNDTWAKSLKRYYNVYYLFCIWYLGSFYGNFLLFDSMGNNGYTVFHIVFCILLLTLTLDWSTFLLFESTGIMGALLLQKLFRGTFLPEEFTASFIILFLTAAMIGLLITHQKTSIKKVLKGRLDLRDEEKEWLSTTYETMRSKLRVEMHEESLPMQEISQALEDLADKEENANSIRRIQDAVTYLQSHTMIASEFMPLKVEEVAVQTILDSVVDYLRNEDVKVSDRVSLKNNTKRNYLFCDENLLVKALAGGISALITSHPDDGMVFRLEEGTIAYNFPGCKRTIPVLSFVIGTGEEAERAIAYPKFYKPFLHEEEFPPNLRQGMRIAHAHYGAFERVSDSLLLLVVPANIKEVRPAKALLFDEGKIEKTSITGEEDKAFLRAVTATGHPFNRARIERALRTCKHYHRKQKRKSGEPFYLHPVAVATILLSYTDDEAIIIAALLHDVVEDTSFSFYQLEVMFGTKVRGIVEEVTHLYDRLGRKVKLSKKGKLGELLTNGAKEPQLVKLADRLHNMRTIHGHRPARQREIAQETLDFFIPVAKCLEQPAIEEELRDLAYGVLEGSS